MGKDTLRVLIFTILIMLLCCTIAPTQPEWAVLDSPPTGTAPAGEVLRPGHLGREIGNVEHIFNRKGLQ